MRFQFYLFILVFMLSPLAMAEQLHFSKEKQQESYQFNYQWLNNKNENKALSFVINEEALFEKFRDFKAYKSDVARQYIQQGIYKKVRRNPLMGVRVKFRKEGNNTVIRVLGNNDQAIAKAHQALRKIENEVTEAYFQENFYHRFTTYDLIQGIKPDHVSIANKSVEDLKPLKEIILEQVSIQNIRTATNYTLSFIQNIPYSILESRVTSSGAGFNPPLKVLWENQGDCDSKVTLTAAVLRMLMPRIKMVLVFIDQHALIGIDIPVKGDEENITLDGVTYILAEPTGPTLLNLGEIAPASSMAIASGHYVAEKYHAVID